MKNNQLGANDYRVMEELLHDLMNPITTLDLVLSSLTFKDPTLKKSRNKIGYIVKTLSTLLGNNRSTIYLTEDLQTIIESMKAKSKLKNVSFVFIHNTNARLACEPLPFYRIFLNLISNAIDSYDCVERKNAKRKIIISDEIDNNGINIYVEDFGCGIEKEEIGKITKRGHTSKTQNKGLGLHIVQMHLKKLGSKMEILPKEKCGTIVKITFPKELVLE